LSDDSLRRAKRPRSILAGPYGHPVHALLITLPIGAWTASIVFDLLNFVVVDDAAAFATGAQWLIGIGLVGAGLAAVAGFLDLSVLGRGTRARAIAIVHAVINGVTALLFFSSLLLRVDEAAVPVAAFVLSVIAIALLSLSGVLGGELTYRYGVRVADESTQRPAHVPGDGRLGRARRR